MIRNSLRAAVLVCALPALLLGQTPKPLTIAAASDLQTVLPEIVREFERTAAARVTVAYGSSGTFFAQIQNGAPFDVFLSADPGSWPTRDWRTRPRCSCTRPVTWWCGLAASRSSISARGWPR